MQGKSFLTDQAVLVAQTILPPPPKASRFEGVQLISGGLGGLGLLTAMAWAFTGLTQGLGLGLAAVAAVGAAIAALWAMVGIYLGRWFEQGTNQAPDDLT